jgi:hypothetical protein
MDFIYVRSCPSLSLLFRQDTVTTTDNLILFISQLVLVSLMLQYQFSLPRLREALRLTVEQNEQEPKSIRADSIDVWHWQQISLAWQLIH